MNRKTLYLNVLAAALFSMAGTAQAGKPTPLAEAIHMQMRAASANIQADIRADVHNQTRTLDVPGVEIGTLELVEGETPAPVRADALLETAGVFDTLREDLVLKALEAPGMFGVYRYMAASALTVAIIVAE